MKSKSPAVVMATGKCGCGGHSTSTKKCGKCERPLCDSCLESSTTGEGRKFGPLCIADFERMDLHELEQLRAERAERALRQLHGAVHYDGMLEGDLLAIAPRPASLQAAFYETCEVLGLPAATRPMRPPQAVGEATVHVLQGGEGLRAVFVDLKPTPRSRHTPHRAERELRAFAFRFAAHIEELALELSSGPAWSTRVTHDPSNKTIGVMVEISGESPAVVDLVKRAIVKLGEGFGLWPRGDS
jgi:hypothetical protein